MKGRKGGKLEDMEGTEIQREEGKKMGDSKGLEVKKIERKKIEERNKRHGRDRYSKIGR